MQNASCLNQVKCNCGKPIVHAHLKEANKELYAVLKKNKDSLSSQIEKGCKCQRNIEVRMLQCNHILCEACIKE